MMKKIVYLLVLQLACWQTVAHADDIDVYINSKASSIPLLMLMLDYRPDTFNPYPACKKGIDLVCAESMSPGVLDALQKNRVLDLIPLTEPVSRYEIFRAILQSVINTPDLDGPPGAGAFDCAGRKSSARRGLPRRN